MFRSGDIACVTKGLDAGMNVIILEVDDDIILCTPKEKNKCFQELYGIAGDFGFHVNSLELTEPAIQKGDIVTVRSSSREGKKNVNKKARPGMEGTVNKIEKYFATVNFTNGEVHRVGIKLLDRKSFVDENKKKRISFKQHDVLVVDGSIGRVSTKGVRESVLRTVNGESQLFKNKDVTYRVSITEMLKKALVQERGPDEGTKESLERTKKELEKLYADEFSIKKIKHQKIKRRAQETIKQLIRSNLRNFKDYSRKTKWIVFPGMEPIRLDRLRNRSNEIKQMFYNYLCWKRNEKPKIETSWVESLFEFNLEKQGNVNAKPGQYIEFKKYLENKNLGIYRKSPGKLKGHFLGIEIECYTNIGHDELISQLKDAGLDRCTYVTHDGSLRPNDDQVSTEVCVLVKEDKYREIIPRVMKVINANSGAVNYACGVHVHMDMRNRDPQNAYQKLFNAQQFLFDAIPADRRTNEYCVPNKYSDIERQTQHANESSSGRFRRYSAINTNSIDRHNTIEVRMHEGTVDAERLCHWIDTLISIVNTKAMLKKPNDLDSFLSVLENYTEEQQQLFRNRVQEFAA